MKLEFRPVHVATGSEDTEGLLALVDEQLVAVLVRLSELHDELAGYWFIEAAFGLRHSHRTFRDLDSAQQWLLSRVKVRPGVE